MTMNWTLRHALRPLIRWIDPKYAITTGEHYIRGVGYRTGFDLLRHRVAYQVAMIAFQYRKAPA